MVTLRHFENNDAVVLRQFENINMPIEEIRNMICDWNKLEVSGKYFEIFAIINDGQIVGSISLYQHSDTVISIGPEILPAFKKQGFGKQAMLIALDIAKSKGYKIVSQQIRSNNTASIALHKSLDFETDNYSYINKKGNEVFIFLKALF